VFAIDLHTSVNVPVIAVSAVAAALNQLCLLGKAKVITYTDQNRGETWSGEAHFNPTLFFGQIHGHGREKSLRSMVNARSGMCLVPKQDRERIALMQILRRQTPRTIVARENGMMPTCS
jgi:hypothetical protein